MALSRRLAMHRAATFHSGMVASPYFKTKEAHVRIVEVRTRCGLRAPNNSFLPEMGFSG